MKEHKKTIKVAIGFVTGRKNFKNLAKTYAHSCNEYELVKNSKVSLNLFVAYDLKYSNTKVSDYKNIDQEIYHWMDSVHFIGSNTITNEINDLTQNGIITGKEAKLIFGDGYGKKRNIIMYFALKNDMDYLIFLDDDEYPVAPVRTANGQIIWMGQSVISTHLKYISGADITHGHHCGFISPIPYIEFNHTLSEEDFRTFIEAISNDIISWSSIKNKMLNGGITYAEKEILSRAYATEVKEIRKCKFISGSNLCINLKHVDKIAPFYNPPEARGEDTFLSTCLSHAKVLKVPCYTFHDGFLHYAHLLHGVLPRSLKPVTADSQRTIMRFMKASIGWVRYKPLLLYITQRNNYEIEIEKMKHSIDIVLPKLCEYFHNDGFAIITKDLDYYHRNVRRHFQAFEDTKNAWRKVIMYAKEQKAISPVA